MAPFRDIDNLTSKPNSNSKEIEIMALNWFKSVAGDLQTKFNQLNNATFKNAAMATCALVASADGSIDPSEKKKVAQLIQKNCESWEE